MAICSWVRLHSSISLWKLRATSIGSRFSLWMFSTMAISSIPWSLVSRMYAGIISMPHIWHALNLRSPLIIWYLSADFLRTVIGWIKPRVLTESASSSKASWSNDILGWNGLGSIMSAGIRKMSEVSCFCVVVLTIPLFTYPTGFLMLLRSVSSPSRAPRPFPSPLCCLLIFVLLNVSHYCCTAGVAAFFSNSSLARLR